jgi:hypothetical protein
LYGVEIGTDKLGGITQMNINTGTESRGDVSDGSVFPEVASIFGQKPRITFTTMAIDKALSVLTFEGVSLTANVLKAYAHRHAIGGARAEGASHRLYTCSYGVAVPQILSADHGENASLTALCVLAASPDGATAPIVETEDATLPSGFDDEARWTIGPVVIGGVTIESLKSISIDFGLQATGEAADGDIWDTFHSVTNAQPVITMRGVDVEWLKAANIPLAGKVATIANTDIYFRKRLSGGQYVADNVSEHIKINVAGVIHMDDVFDGSSGGPAEVSLTIRPYDDGTNDTFTIATASAIT